MVRTIPPRSFAAVLPLVALMGCGGPHGGAPPPSGSAEKTIETPQRASATPESARVSRAPSAAGRPLAIVNGTPIAAERVASVYRMNRTMLQQRGRTLSEADDRALKTQSLEAVVADELLFQAAVAKGITVSASEIDAAMKRIKLRAGSDEAYAKLLASSGLTDAGAHAEIERNLRTEAFRKSLLAGKDVSEADAKKYYDANAPKGMFNVPERIHVRLILVRASDSDPEPVRAEAKKRAEEAARRATAGEDFAGLARQYSQDPAAANGGDIGVVPKGAMFPKFEEIAFATKPGEVSPVFQTPQGFNVLKVLEKLPVSTQSYDEVKSSLQREMSLMMEQEVVGAKVRELAATAKIKVLDTSPPQPAPPPSRKP